MGVSCSVTFGSRDKGIKFFSARDSARDPDRDDDLASHMQVHETWWGSGASSSSKEKLARSSKAPNKSKVTTTLTQADTEHVFGEITWWRFKVHTKFCLVYSTIVFPRIILFALSFLFIFVFLGIVLPKSI